MLFFKPMIKMRIRISNFTLLKWGSARTKLPYMSPIEGLDKTNHVDNLIDNGYY